MRTVKTDTFSLDIPDLFESVRPIWESIRAEHAIPDEAVMFTAGLNDASHLKRDFSNVYCGLERS